MLGTLVPKSVRVQLYAEPLSGRGPVLADMSHVPAQAGAAIEIYTASVPAERPAGDYTVRIVPALAGALIPLEAAHILWQR